MDLVPYCSVGPLTFGMSSDDVEGVLGPPRVRMRNFLKELKFVYPDLNVEFSTNGLVEVTFSPSQQLTINGRLISNTPEGRIALLAMCNNPFCGVGSLILTDMGVAIPDDDGPPYPLTAFARGRMDGLLTTCERS